MTRPFTQRVHHDRAFTAAVIAAPCVCGHSRFDHLVGSRLVGCARVLNGREYCTCERYAPPACNAEVA